MKKLLALLLLSPLVSGEEKILVEMNCKATGQTIIQSVDGVAKTYLKFENGLDIGDIFTVNFEFNEYPVTEAYNIILSNRILEIANFVNNTVSKSIIGNKGISYELPYGLSMIKEGFFSFKGPFSSLSASRYYKNDWHIMIISESLVSKASHTLTANCINMPSTWDEMINKIKIYEKDKWLTDDID